jgi:two-component system LytT family sensor kinase
MLDFADYTRYSLARNGEYTMVSDEFHAIETYLALQRAVLGDRLQVQVRWRPKCSRSPCRTWSWNRWWRTRSATASRSGAGLVQVRGEAEGNQCVISVEDDGLGMDPGKRRTSSPGEVKRAASVWPMWTVGCAASTARGSAWW